MRAEDGVYHMFTDVVCQDWSPGFHELNAQLEHSSSRFEAFCCRLPLPLPLLIAPVKSQLPARAVGLAWHCCRPVRGRCNKHQPEDSARAGRHVFAVSHRNPGTHKLPPSSRPAAVSLQLLLTLTHFRPGA